MDAEPQSPAPPLPKLAISMGDPTGIGPEIIVAALKQPWLRSLCKPLVIGRPAILRRACEWLGTPTQIVEVEARDPIPEDLQTIACLTCGSVEAEDAPAGKIDRRGGQAAYDALVLGTRLALEGTVDGLVTAPLHKAALHAAGHRWPGHTELLAHLCKSSSFAMMLYLPPSDRWKNPVGLGLVHVTLHCSLRSVFDQLSPDSIFAKIELAHDAFLRLRKGVGLPETPRIAVAALNPHAGEHGLFGDEETRCIEPAVIRAQDSGWNVQGPIAADTLMPRAVSGEFDAVVAMYHDQGHIALKLLHFLDAVNVTLGLPIIRTSVAHGTAHDRAWTGEAKSDGMEQAIRTAAWLANASFRMPSRP